MVPALLLLQDLLLDVQLLLKSHHLTRQLEERRGEERRGEERRDRKERRGEMRGQDRRRENR